MSYSGNVIFDYKQLVLIVDDVHLNVTLLSEMLHGMNVEVITANNGEEAILLAEREKPDLILLDIMMPEMDGYTVCRRLKEDPITTEIPVIFITAKTAQEDILRGFDAGAVDYVVKPFNRKELFRRIGIQLELYKKNFISANFINIIDKYVLTSFTDTEGNITYASDAFCKLTGYSFDEIVGKNHRIIRHEDMDGDVYADLWETLKLGKIWYGELKNKSKNGEEFWTSISIEPVKNKRNKLLGYQAIRADITDRKKIEILSITDRLTGLYNRLKIDEILEYELTKCLRYGNKFSLIMADLDHFKNVNDLYGHLAGDKVLIEFAEILRQHTRKSDAVGRWGGEEFLVTLPETNIDEAHVLAERIRLVTEQYQFSNIRSKTASFGVSTYREGDNIISLVGRADEALYKAKSEGRNKVISIS